MGFMDGLGAAAGGFAQGFNPTFAARQNRIQTSEQMALRKEALARELAIREQSQALQNQQLQRQQATNEYLGGMMGGVPEGVNALQVAQMKKALTPVRQKANMQLVEMGGEQGYGNYLVNLDTGAKSFMGGGKRNTPTPSYDIFTMADGSQQYLQKGAEIPQGASKVVGKGITINTANQEREDYAKEIQNKYANNSIAALNDIKSISDSSKAPVFGAMGLGLSTVPGTNAYSVAKMIDTVNSSVSFNRLNEMRQASKTGGALGAVSEKELDLLKNSVASLDQGLSPEVFWSNWQRVMSNFDQVINGTQAQQPTSQADPLGLR